MTTFDALTAESSEPVREIARLLRDLLRSRFPSAVEQVDLGNRVAAYGTSERMRDIAFAIAPHSAHVNLQLADGVELDDPTGIVEGTGKRIRHVKCRSPDDVTRPAVLALIDEQLALRGLS
jgi:hypothetical protein